MEILENITHWQAAYEQGWLAHYRKTGQTDWQIYNRPQNRAAPAGAGVDLSRSRLALISSAGGYLREEQAPFEAENELGDYTIRTFPSETPFERIAFAHSHYDQAAVTQDPQVLLPLRHLEDMAAEGLIGQVAPAVINFSGYQPDVVRVLEETIPAILAAAQAQEIDAALLVPA